MKKKKKLWHKKKSFKVGITIALISIVVMFVVISIIVGSKTPSSKKQVNGIPEIDVNWIKSNTKIISYDELFRYNDKHINELVYFRGEIMQIQKYPDGSVFLRIATKKSSFGYFGEIIGVYHDGKDRILEGDIIDVWGTVYGLLTYTALLGNEITIPTIVEFHTELVTKGTSTTTPISPKEPNSETTGKIYEETSDGITLKITGYDFEKITGDYGTLKSIDFTLINNQGSKSISPNLVIDVLDNGRPNCNKEKEIGLSEYLSSGDAIQKKVSVDLDICGIQNQKKMKVHVQDWFDILLTVSFDTNLTEGFS